jgi:hypothetical protein
MGESGNYAKPGMEKRVCFLAQIDFWDWEVENLIFCFQNFQERSKVWEDEGLETTLRTGGFVLHRDILRDLDGLRRNKRWWHSDEQSQVVAPVKKLNEVIAAWNNLLSFCERTLFMPGLAKKKEEFAMAVEANLDKYRKKPVEVTLNNV